MTETVVGVLGDRSERVSIFAGSTHFHSAAEHVGLFPVEKREELSRGRERLRLRSLPVVDADHPTQGSRHFQRVREQLVS